MAIRRSKSWYISRLVRANGFVKDEVVNVSGGTGSADSDVAAIAQLRREADSDELAIQAIRSAVDSDYALFNTKIAAFQGLNDSDLTTVSNLRNDLDSESTVIKVINTTVAAIPSTNDVPAWADSDREASHSPRVYRITAESQLDTINQNNGLGTRIGVARVGDIAFLAHQLKAWVLTDISAPVPATYSATNFHVQTGNGTVTRMHFDVVPAGQLPSGNFAIGMEISNRTYARDVRTITGVSDTGGSYSKGYLDFTPSDAGYPPGWDNENVYVKITDLTTWQSFSFDSDAIKAIILENTSAASIDSDVAAVAALRRDADSDSVVIQALRTSMDSDYALFNAKFALLSGLTDSDLTTVANLRNDLDSESSVIRTLVTTTSAATSITQTVYTYTTTEPQTTFSGGDDNSETLSYTVGRIQVYLNGLLLSEGASADYTATNGTSVVLTEASDSEDVLTVVKYLGTNDDVLTTKYIYKVISGSHSAGDSEFTGADDNGKVLSYTTGKIQVFLNGILLNDSDDYIATNGSSIYLLTAPDSEDVLVVYRYIGTQVAGFDSDQVVSIINENLPVDQTGFDSDQVVAIINENTGSAGFDSDQVVAIINENAQAIETTVFTFTATNNDSDFTGNDDNGSTLSYVAGKIQVYLNGVLLTDTTDYLANDGSTISLVSAPDSDDVLSIVKFLGTVQSGFDSDQVTGIVKETFTNLGNRNILLGGAEKDSDVLGYHVKILGNESNVDSEQNSFNLRNYVERKVCRVVGTTTLAYIYYGGFPNEYGSGNQYDRGAVFINWTGHISAGPGIIYGRALHFTKQGNTITQGQAFAGSTDGNLPTTSITHDASNERFIVSIANGWGTADVTIQVGRYQKQIEWLV